MGGHGGQRLIVLDIFLLFFSFTLPNYCSLFDFFCSEDLSSISVLIIFFIFAYWHCAGYVEDIQ